MPAAKRHKSDPIHLSSSSSSAAVVAEFTPIRLSLALALIAACLKGDLTTATQLIAEQADAWVQDDLGQTSLHAAVRSGNAQLVTFLLKSSNAVWNMTDVLGMTAGDLAYSLNEDECYSIILQEGVRTELLKAMMRKMAGSPPSSDDEDDEVGEEEEQPLSTAGSNKTFLNSRLTFQLDANGQEICVDAEGNGVMMGWEREIMNRTAELLCHTRSAVDGELWVLNVGFGLGIIDSAFQTYSPSNHVIIEAHPDVIAHAKSLGWYDKPNVRFYEGTWRQYIEDVNDGIEEVGRGFDAVYFDTYSEHYHDLHSFFRQVPQLLHCSESLFSFFHGLGATHQLFYDVYTIVAETHLRMIKFNTTWSEVLVRDGGESWIGLGDRKYWGEVGPYRLPICQAMS